MLKLLLFCNRKIDATGFRSSELLPKNANFYFHHICCVPVHSHFLDNTFNFWKVRVVKISELLSVNSRTVLRTFKNLQENSNIKRLGNNRTGEWQIL